MSNTVAQLSSDTKIAISLKKLQGKAHTKTENELYNEGLPSGITMDSSTVFGSTPPTNPTTTLGAITGGVVEKVRLTCTFIAGSDTPSGRHGYKLSLASDYETTSTNPKAGTGPFVNDGELVSSNGVLQLVPPSFDYRYEAVPYYGAVGSLTSIPLADPRDWNLDYFNGVYFQQDPPTNTSENPTFIDAYLYIGDFLDTVVANAGGTTTFTSLTDTPANYGSAAGQIVKVNSGGTGLEFGTITMPTNFVGDDGDDTVDDEAAGLVPAPVHGDAAAGKYLKADGTWSTPPDNDTTYQSSDFDHNQLTNYVANEHIDWTQASAGTIDPSNYTDTTYSNFVGDDGDPAVNDEAAGLVPAPAHGDAAAGKYLNADGTWSTPPDTTYSVFVGDDGDNTVNNESYGLVPAPAHGDAAIGKFLKADGTWAVPAGGGGGGGGGAAATGYDQYVLRVATQTNALTATQIVGLDTTNVGAGASLSVYLNGDLLMSGSQTQVTDFSNQDPRLPSTTNTHYYVSSTDELTFGFAMVPGDYVQVEKLSFNANPPVSSVTTQNGIKQNANTGNIVIEPNYDGDIESIIKKAYDGTGITVDPDNDYLLLHDVTDQQVKYIKANQVGSGQAGIIGDAEDGTYTDGLFVDFIPSTPTGTAVDRFNEVFKYLAPPPAPPVRSIDYSVSGGSVYSGLLSFDETHVDPNGEFENVVTYTQEGQSGFATPSVGDNYTTDSITHTESNHDGSDLYFYRIGILSGTQTVAGEVNFNVPIEQTANGVVQYTEDSFGNAEIGSLVLELNDNQIHTMDLTVPTLGAGQPPNGNANETSLNADGSGFTHVSELRSAYTEGGKEFPIFKHRTVRYKVTPASMQKGLNKVRVLHVMGSTVATNFVEWVLDDSTDPIGFSNTTITPTNQQGSTWISGVQYYSSLDLDYATDVSNAYKAVHSSGQITTTTSAGNGGTGTNMPTMGPTDDLTKEINFSQTIPVTATVDPLLNQTVSVSITVPHPIKGSASGGSATTNPILLYNPTASANQTSEDFTKEEFRLQDTTYGSQTAGQASGFYDVTKEWDETTSLAGVDATHNTGLQIYNGRLVSPVNSINTTRVGDFRNITDGGVLVGYAGNPDYSTEAGNITGVRSYFRWFKNTTASNQRDLRILFNGSATLTNSGDTLDSSKIKVSIKLPTGVGGNETGWMDANSQYQMFDHGDDDGGYIGTHTSSISGSVTNYFTFGQREVLPNEVVIVRIEADTSWTGNLTSLSVQWGASDSGNTAPGALAITAVPLEQVSIGGSGTDVKLSFGPSNPIASYEDVSDAGDENPATGVIDYNGSYNESGYRLSAFVSHLAQGAVNTTQNSRIDRGHLGELKLEVNDTIIALATVDFTNLTSSGNFVDGDGTGFYNVSAATASVYSSNSLPSYNNIYRTAEVRVQSASQRQGHNYYRVIHTVDGVDSVTNYCEWLLDGDNSTFDTSGETMEDWTDSSSVTQSGIKYFSSPESVVKYRVEGAHKNVYSPANDAIGWRNITRVSVDDWTIVGAGINDVTGITSTSRAMPTLIPNGQLEPMDVTGSISWNGSAKVMPGSLGTNSNQSVSIRARIKHPLKLVNGNHWVDTSTMSKSGFLIHSGFNDTSTTISENFSGENYRILSNTDFSLVSNISQGVWDSTEDLSGGTAGYSDGLCQYNGNLVAPANAGSNGDFRNIADNGTLQGPTGNVNYSGLAGNNERVYIRPFYNATGSSKSRFDITITGVGTLTSETQSDNNAGPLNASNFKMFIKIVEPTASPATTGWLDCGEHSNSSVTDNSGCRYGALNNQLPVNIASTTSFEVVMPSGRDLNAAGSNLLLIKIVANDDWTGRITSLGISL